MSEHECPICRGNGCELCSDPVPRKEYQQTPLTAAQEPEPKSVPVERLRKFADRWRPPILQQASFIKTIQYGVRKEFVAELDALIAECEKEV